MGKDFDILLISPGGTGSTSGFKFFQERLGIQESAMNNFGDHDGLKHLKYPSLQKKLLLCNISKKLIVYQFGSPMDAVFSLYRRGFAAAHFAKLDSPLRSSHCFEREEEKKNVSLYINSGADLLGLRDHFESYLLASIHVPIVFIRSSSRSDPLVIYRLSKLLDQFNIKNVVDTLRPVEQPSVHESKYEHEQGYHALSKVYFNFRMMLENFGSLSLAGDGLIYRLV